MLSFPVDTKHEAKICITHGTMGHLDPKQPPVKRKPFSAILNQHFVHKVEFILPEELYELVKDTLFGVLANPSYCKVVLPLKSLVEGDFFNEYIKKGKILMLSEGRPGVDNVYTLRKGILSLYLDKKSYERAGLVGKPDGVKGNRGTKPRWIVEINLRLPSMLHGKKGFDRIVYAFKNVLTTPVTWLFCNVYTETPKPDPLDQHFPHRISCTPSLVQHIKATVPILRPPMTLEIASHDSDFEDFSVDIHEWLSLISLESPRIDPNDQIDSFLSRYTPPANSNAMSSLVKVTWHGFISPSWVHKSFVQALLVVPRDAWFVYHMGGFSEVPLDDSTDYTILKVADAPGEYVLWEPA